MKNLKILLVAFLLFTFNTGVFAQTLVKACLKDKITDQVIADAAIVPVGANIGVTSDINGCFSLEVPNHVKQISISSLGYKTRILQLPVSDDKTIDLGVMRLTPESYALDEVSIISSIAKERTTPVAISSIKSEVIENQLGDQPFPNIMKMIPGVYATRYGGGSGDARVSLRGFQQENIAVLLNGIPVSSVENGLVYWNNWLGLTDATEFIQVQKGLGSSNLALNSVGGTINIITKTAKNEKSGSLRYSVSSYGNQKTTLTLNSGKLKNGFSISFMGSRTSGPGYVDATYVDSWSYFLNIRKDINPKHSLVFTALGAPERHGQRNFKLSQEEINLHGVKYNKDWGSYNGRINNMSENFYHKPHLSLNHYWKIDNKNFLENSAYLSFGYGGGKWSETFGYNLRIPQYINPSGQIDWRRVYRTNYYNNDTTYLEDGTPVTGYSKNVQTHFRANHIWYGVISNFKHNFNDHLTWSSGIHLRHFKSHLYEKIQDLLGGNFWVEDYAWSLADIAGREQIKTVGDIIKINNYSYVDFGSIFTQLEFNNELITTYLSFSLSGSRFQREDKYNYIENTLSEPVSKPGFDIRTGINYNINENNRIFLNAGYYDKAPLYKFVFGNYSNTPVYSLKNEKIKAIETGYDYSGITTSISINAYYTYWEDKNFLSNEYIQLQNDQQSRALVTGLDAEHAGFEIEIRQQINNNLWFGGIASVGSWKWKNDVNAVLFNDNNVAVDTVFVYANGLYVGDAPQTQFGLFGKIRISDLIDLKANWLYYDKLYADFDPSSGNDPDDKSQSYRLPSYSILDVHLGYSFELFNNNAYGSISCFNVLDKRYIVRGEDGKDHNLESFRGFWSFGRNFNFSIKISI